MHETNDKAWTIEYTELQPDHLIVEESLFSLANGYLGVRGNIEEYDSLYNSYPWPTIRGTYINGFYDEVPIEYDEKAYGFPESKQKMVNLPDTQTIRIELDDEWFELNEGTIIDYRRTLDLRKGYTERYIHLMTPKGKDLKLVFKRLVSFTYREVFAQEVTISSTNYEGPIRFLLVLNGDVNNFVAKDDPRVASGHAKNLRITGFEKADEGVLIKTTTKRSNLVVYTFMRPKVNVPYRESIEWQETRFEWFIECELNGNDVSLYKQNLYFDSIRYGQPKESLFNRLKEIKHLSFNDLLEKQTKKLTAYYKAADIIIDGDEKLQEGIRFNLFHLFQSVGRDQYSNVSAKGLSGEGYEGHYFWDTEIYILPVFMTTKPEMARNLLLYRYHILDGARNHARIMGHKKGALYPWRTIKGTECSSYFPAGSAQYHINADIAYGFIQYYLATGDEDFLFNYGAEVIFETARLFLDVGHYQDGKFHIYAVTGPDEYTAIVNDNFYTNAMAKFNLKWAVKIFKLMKEKAPEVLIKLMDKINLIEDEVKQFKEASDKMTLLFNEERQIHMQDDSFIKKPVWNFKDTPDDHYPLLLHYHPLTIYRHQVCKQPDVVLAHFLLDDFPLDVMKNSYDYYEAVTTHDSSLSTCIYSIMASRIGDVERAYRFLLETARTDLDNTQKNTKDGLHMANMGGTYMALVHGFAGLRIKEEGLILRPILPQEINHLAFPLRYQERTIRVDITHKRTKIELEAGESLTIYVYDKPYQLTMKNPVILSGRDQ